MKCKIYLVIACAWTTSKNYMFLRILNELKLLNELLKSLKLFQSILEVLENAVQRMS